MSYENVDNGMIETPDQRHRREEREEQAELAFIDAREAGACDCELWGDWLAENIGSKKFTSDEVASFAQAAKFNESIMEDASNEMLLVTILAGYGSNKVTKDCTSVLCSRFLDANEEFFRRGGRRYV